MKRYDDCPYENSECRKCSLSSYERDCHSNPAHPLAYSRKMRGMSQRKLADASGIYKSTIIAIEAGKSRTENISLRKAKGLADALGITMEQLLDLDN